MSDPKCATLITVDAPKSGKNNVNKTVRLTINLDESNESKYPELNYKELVIAEERKKHVQNGKTAGLDPFSDNDDDVERVVRKIEQKYGSKSSYARKGRPNKDDFADIGAGYDENDSFIDNTDGYDEMIPPECDTLYGGFYINSGSLEFKMVPQNHGTNKRRIESSSSEEESSDSSTSESQDEKDPKPVATSPVHSHNTEHRKKKNKKNDKNKAEKIRRTDSSAANSGKQTSDENVQADGESVDSRTSQSDSLTSKPAPSSENAITSDSSRDVEAKTEVKLPPQICEVLECLEATLETYMTEHPTAPAKSLLAHSEHYFVRLEGVLKAQPDTCVSKAAWSRAARALRLSRGKLMPRLKALLDKADSTDKDQTTSSNTAPAPAAPPVVNNKRKHEEIEDIDYEVLTDQQREAKIVETLERLKDLIDERKPAMLANYHAECERVQEERKKLQLAALAEGGAAAERRLPKRRFPWCGAARGALARLARLARDPAAAAALLAARALPLFPAGFVRMPTLLRQADLSKEVKASDIKRKRLGSLSHQPVMHQNQTTLSQTQSSNNIPVQEPIQFPSSLTVTTTVKTSSPEKTEIPSLEDKYKSKSLFGSIAKTYSLSKDLIVEKEAKEDMKEDLYVPPNNIGSITITPVPLQQKEKKSNTSLLDKHTGLIRVKSPASLNEMVSKKDVKVIKKQEKSQHSNPKEKRVESPLHIDTSYQPSKKDPSPKDSHSNKKDPSPKTKDEITQKQIENMRVAENNIPRPALVPVHHSPTFAKPDKRPPEVKKKKDLIVVSDVDPLSDISEPLNVDDSSSDSVEVIETTDKSDSVVVVPSKDKKCVKSVPKVKDGAGDEDEADYETLMRNIREMANSQEPPNFNSNAFSSVITTAKHEMSSNRGNFARNTILGTRNEKDKFTERPSLNKMDGSNAITG